MSRRSPRAALTLAAILVVSLALWSTLVVPRLPGPPEAGYAWNVVAAAAMVVLVRRWGLSWAELGLSRYRLRAGLRWGLVSAALVAAVYGLLFVVPQGRAVLADARAAGLRPEQVLLGALIHIPLGTVLWEELTFRGALLAALLRVARPSTAMAFSSFVFGLWHIRPAQSALAAASLPSDPAVAAGATAVVVVATAVAGGLFCWLRLRSASLLAPFGLHLAINSLGLVAAWGSGWLG